jgi:hypothetical protein
VNKKGEEAFFNTLDQNQKILYLQGRIEQQSRQIAELYELNRGALRMGDLSKKLLAVATLIAALFTLGKGIESLEQYFIVRNEQRYSQQDNQKKGGTR